MAGVYCNVESKLVSGVLRKLKELNSKDRFFASPWWARNRHINTLAAFFFRSVGGHSGVGYKRELIKTEDGGTLSLDVSQIGDKYKEGTPFVLMIAGLGGSSEDPYTKAMAAACAQKGWRSAVVCMRGTGNGVVTSPRFFSARRGSTDDVRQAITHLRNAGHVEDHVPIVGVGWSLGACIMTNTVLEQEKLGHNRNSLKAAAALACPFDLGEASKLLENFPNSVYDARLAKGLVNLYKPHAEKSEGVSKNYMGEDFKVDTEKIVQVQRVKHFDDHLTAPFFGFGSAMEYYAYSSTRTRLNEASPSIPMVMISALDDPIVGDFGIPFEAARNNPNLVLIATYHGGHLGWVEGSHLGCGYAKDQSKPSWTEKVVLNFLEHAVCFVEETERGLPPAQSP